MNREQLSRPGWKQRFRRWMNRLIEQKWFDIGLRGKMSALVTIGLTGLLGIFAYLAIASIRQATQQLLGEHVLRARILAGNLDSNLGQVAGLLRVLASQADVDHPQAAFQSQPLGFEDEFAAIQGIYLFDRSSNLIASTSALPGVDWKAVSGLQQAASGAPRTVSIVGLPRPYALIAVPVLRTNSQLPTGVLAAILDLSNPRIFHSGGSLDIEPDGVIQVLDGTGQILVSSQPDQALTSATIQNITDRLFVEGQPMVEACLGCTGDELDETGTVIAFAPLSQAPWGLVLWHDSQAVFAPVRRLAVQTLVLGVLAMLGAFLLVLVTTQSVIAPVQTLTEATRRISELQSDTSALEAVECALSDSLGTKSTRRDEIGILSNGFVTMCRRLRHSMEEIRLWNRELDNRVQARTQQLSTLNAVALTVNESLNLEDILNRALDEVLQLAGIDMAAIFLQEAPGGHLELMACRGLSQDAARLAHQVGLLDSSCGGVMETGKVVTVPDLTPYGGKGAESLQRERITALMHVPLITKGWAFGSMCVGTRGARPFDAEEEKLLLAISSQISIAVENARLYAEVQRKEWVRGTLFKKALAAQEDERKRIARELHDEVSQSLTALLYLAEGGLEVNQRPALRQKWQGICDLTQHTLDSIHKLIFDLRPSMLDQLGLIPAVRWLAETHLRPRGIRVSVDASSDPELLDSEADYQRLSPEIETALYRVVQEAVNNIARHAGARNVEIQLRLHEDTATINIRDDGIGFDVEDLDRTLTGVADEDKIPAESMRGLGIIGMQERIELVGGSMEIRSAPGSGTQIEIQIPLQAPERSAADD